MAPPKPDSAETQVKQPLSETGYNNAVTTRAKSRQQKDANQVHTPPVQSSQTDGPDPLVAVPRRRRRKLKHDANLQKVLEPWTPEFLREKQSEDNDLLQIQWWIENNSKPHWDNI